MPAHLAPPIRSPPAQDACSDDPPPARCRRQRMLPATLPTRIGRPADAAAALEQQEQDSALAQPGDVKLQVTRLVAGKRGLRPVRSVTSASVNSWSTGATGATGAADLAGLRRSSTREGHRRVFRDGCLVCFSTDHADDPPPDRPSRGLNTPALSGTPPKTDSGSLVGPPMLPLLVLSRVRRAITSRPGIIRERRLRAASAAYTKASSA